MINHIKISKTFLDGSGCRSSWVFYINEELAATDNHPHRFSYMRLLAMSTIALKDDKVEKCRFHSNEEMFDGLMGLS